MTARVLLMTSALFFAAGAAEAAGVNTLNDLKVTKTPQGATLVVQGTTAPTFTVFRLSEPDRLVVDMSGSDVASIKGHHEGVGPVTGIVASQFSDEHASVGRLLIGLDGVSRYDVRAQGKSVVVTIEGKAVTSAEPTPGAGNVKVAEAPSAAKPEVKPAEVAAPAVASTDAREGVVASRVDEVQVTKPATRVTSLALKNGVLTVGADGEIPKFELIELQSPARLAVDLYGMKKGAKLPRAHGAPVKDIRAAAHEDKLRLVLEMDGEMPVYRAARTKRGLEITLNGRAAQTAAVEATEADSVATPVVEIDGKAMSVESPQPVVATAGKMADVRSLEFKESPAGGTLELKLTREVAWRVERPDPKSAVLTIDSARLPKRLERSLDTSALGTPVKMVSAFAVRGASERVRIVVAADTAFEESATKTPEGMKWALGVKGVQLEEAVSANKTAGDHSGPPGGGGGEAPAVEASGGIQAGQVGASSVKYVGKRVSFEFKDIDIHDMLRIIAEISKKNIVLADDVSGRITIRLKNVPWDQALELILRSKGLGKEDLGSNIVRVAPLATLESEAKLRAEREKTLKVQEPLEVHLVPVNYAGASDMAARVKDVLSERGNVSIDARTNTLIVREIKSNVGKVRSLVATLDTQTPQVLIESRIVEANVTFNRSIGIQWGGAATMAPTFGNATGLVFPNAVAIRGASGNDGPLAGTSNTPNWAVNLPTSIGPGAGGGLGFVFGSAGGALQLNLRLSAAEAQGVVKTISSPKVTTLDNVGAKISQGVSIPFSQVSASGVNTAFIEASLSLDVTPHITADGSVLMNIRASNNQPDPSATGANGQPAIQRKEASTQVLVKDNDTTVIGGIYVKTGSSSSASVPLLGRIPLLGFFFRNSREVETRNELLIFITPRILNRQTMATNL